jgi:hypothetical protein
MSFIKNLFGSNDSNANDENKIKRTIFDFFQMDIRNIPDESFIEGETITTKDGNKAVTYRKLLKYKECGIFDIVEVHVIGENYKNVCFMTNNVKSIKMKTALNLIDELFLIYGNDDSNKGMSNKEDIDNYQSKDFNCLFERTWLEYPKYKYPIHFRRMDNELSMTIFGAQKD